MNVLDAARELYEAIGDDEMAIAEIRAEKKVIAKGIALNPSYSSQLTSATINGQSISKQTTITHLQRLKIINRFLNMVDMGFSSSNKTIPIY